MANVNAHDAKKQRENLQASTDRIDLMGIAMMLLNLRAKCSPAQDGIYRNLRTLVRHRKKLVVMKTEVKNRVHTLVDRLFPGFLNEKNTGINAFSKSSLVLMEDRFSAQQIRRRQKSTLIKILKRCATPDAEKIASKLHSYSAQVITTPNEYAATLQLSLEHHIKHFRCLQENIDQLLSEIALVLAQTQAAFLTSIKGVGIVLAAGVDVWPTEPPPDSDLLIKAWRSGEPWIKYRFIHTPHSAFYCQEAWQELRIKGAMEVKRVLHGEKPRACVNREWLVNPRYLL